MLVNKKFLNDFAYVANIYGWSNSDIEEVKKQTRESEELKFYWSELAAAHRSGYKQTEENNFIRLEHWKQLRIDK